MRVIWEKINKYRYYAEIINKLHLAYVHMVSRSRRLAIKLITTGQPWGFCLINTYSGDAFFLLGALKAITTCISAR